MKYILIPADAEYPIALIDKKGDSLDILQAAVAGLIQAAPQNDDSLTVWCNEEGKNDGLPLNERATKLWTELWGGEIDDVIVGDVAITGGGDRNGKTKNISVKWANALLSRNK